MSRHTAIYIDDELDERIEPLLIGKESMAHFVTMATYEKVNRMEARSDRARKQQAEKDAEIFAPIIADVLKSHGLI